MTRKQLVNEAEQSTIRGNKKFAILRYKQSIEKGIKQDGSITRNMILEIIKEL